METETMNGNSSAAVTFESLVTPGQPKHKKKKKKHKKHTEAKTQTDERRVLYHVSESEGSSKLASQVYEKELARLQVELVKMQLELPLRKSAPHDYVRPPRDEQFFVQQIY